MDKSRQKRKPDPRLKIFAQRLKMLREERGWTQEYLAELLDTKKSLISYYENAEREPRYTVILKLRDIFNEDSDWIMGDSNTRRIKKIASGEN